MSNNTVKAADSENRSLTSFLRNAVILYLKEHHNIDWHAVKRGKK